MENSAIIEFQWTTEPNRKYRNFGVSGISIRFGSVRLEKTELKQIAEFRFKKYTMG